MLSSFCSKPECAEKIANDEASFVIQSLLRLLKMEEKECSINGHVTAAACAALAFLACHPIGAKGDACMTGPHRKQLLDAGAFPSLLFALTHPPNDPSCKSVVEQSAAIGVMYLSTMVSPKEPFGREKMFLGWKIG